MRRIAAIALIILTLAGCDGLRGNSRSYRMEQEASYLAGLCTPLTIDKTGNVTGMLEKQLMSQNIILAGEVPGVSGNSELERFFFEAFNGVREIDYLIVELPYSAGEILNDYLSERDEKSLNQVFDALEGRPYATEENRSFYRQLKLFLKSRKQKIEVAGVDMEYAPELSLEYIADVLSQYDNSGYPIASELVDARDKNFTQVDYLQLSFTSLLNVLREDKDNAELLYGDDYASLIHVLEGLEMTYSSSEESQNEQFSHERSEQLVKNFLRIYDKAPEAMYFGQLANPAVMQSKHLDYDWFASAIQKERDSAKGKVISLLYTYEDCQRMVYLGGQPEKEKLDLFKFDDRKVLNAIDQPYTLISLIEKDSIFNDESIIFEKDFEGAVTNYFQYLVVLNESQASKALK